MAHLLHLDSSADAPHSRSRAIGASFAAAFLAADPANTVTHRDLHAERTPHLADAAMHWPERLRTAGPAPDPRALAFQDVLLGELLEADVLLVDAPLYNYSMPSTLKAWIDHIHVPGVTAPFDVDSQPLAGRPAVIVTSRGASYDAGTATADWDHAVPPLRLILGASLGMAVEVITTSLTLAGDVPALRDQLGRSIEELAAAHVAASEAGTRLGRS